MPKSRIALFEPALEEKLFRKLVRAVKGLGSEKLSSTYQTTFWYDFSTPKCLPEKVALELKPYIPKSKKVVGVEWWLSRMKTTEVAVDFHQDRDEKLFLRTGELVTPKVSSVFFLNRCRGGALAVTPDLPNIHHPSLCPDTEEMDVVAPKPNRFVVFDGALTHGVLDAHNNIPVGKLPFEVPLRLAVIYNWWHQRPEATPAWTSTRVYRGLAY